MKNPYIRVLGLCIIQTLILAALFLGGAVKFLQSSNTYIFATASIIGSLIAIGATWLYYKLVDKKSLSAMNLRLNRKQTLFSVLSAVLSMGLSFSFTMIMSSSGNISAQFNKDFFSDVHIIPMFILSAISWFLVGFNEETVCRGYMVDNLKHLSLPKLYFWSSVFFVLSHVFKLGLNPISIGVTLSAAITLMYVYIKTGSIMAATIPHFIYDFMTVQLIGNSDISIIQVNGVPSDMYQAGIHIIFLCTQVILTMLLFKDKISISYKKFESSAL